MFDVEQRTDLLRERADDYVSVALKSATREYPHFPYFIASEPDSYKLHRIFHPAFYGSFDWHSCVEMHWVAVRLMRLFPDALPMDDARRILGALLTKENLEAELSFFRDPNHKSLERPYGWGWLLRLAAELSEWDDSQGQEWSRAVEPLAEYLANAMVSWLPKLTYPNRVGNHPNTAFSLSNLLVFAESRKGAAAEGWRDAVVSTAIRLYQNDRDYPGSFEPSSADFLSPCLCEAELMSRVLPGQEFLPWFEIFLPSLAESEPAALLTPAEVSDPTDGQIAHLHGLNLSRAWALVRLSGTLPDSDPRSGVMMAAAERHAWTSLPHVTGSDYMVEHWLAAYATLLLSAGQAS